MKKITILSALLTIVALSSCSKQVDLGQLPLGGAIPQVDSAPVIVAEADANLTPVQSSVFITNTDCKNGSCEIHAQFMNNGGKQAHDISYSFNINSDAINGAMTSGYQDIINQGETGTIIYYIYYNGNSVPNEKLGSIKVNYIKNANGDRTSASIDVFKQ